MADLVVDGYAEVIEAINDDVDEIEAPVFAGDRTDHAERIYKLKREVAGVPPGCRAARRADAAPR